MRRKLGCGLALLLGLLLAAASPAQAKMVGRIVTEPDDAPPPAAAAPSPIPGPEPVPVPVPARETVPETECDRVAAFHLPHTTAAEVGEQAEPNWSRAVAICTDEARAHKDDPRFVYALGRAQEHLGNYSEALQDFRTASAAGHVDALVELGSLFYFGHGVLQSYPTALEDFRKAADAGSSRALANLAAMYGNGQGVPKDSVKALDLAERAIEAGNPFGLQIVALAYFNGDGVPRDYKMAAQYLQQFGDLGDGRALKFLANMYEGGYLGAPDPAKASELRLRAQRVDPGSKAPVPEHLPPLHAAVAAPAVHPRRYIVYRPVATALGGNVLGGNVLGGSVLGGNAFSPLPTGASCCPNYMLVCSPPLRFCPR